VLGGRERTREHPWIPLALTGKLGVDVLGAGFYLDQMASGQAPWCAYCITGAFSLLGALLLSLPESWQATRALAR
jgi:hypothetical protein